MTGSESFSQHIESGGGGSGTGGRLGGRRSVLISLIVLRAIQKKEKPGSNLRGFSKLLPGLLIA